MKKNSQSSISTEKSATRCTQWIDKIEQNQVRWSGPQANVYRKELGEILLSHVLQDLEDQLHNQRVLGLKRWFQRQGIPWSTVHSWLKQDPVFKSLYLEAKAALGELNAIGAQVGLLKETSTLKLLPRYDNDWDENKGFKELLVDLPKPKDESDNKYVFRIEQVPVLETK